jgi:ferrous iron transport protein A
VQTRQTLARLRPGEKAVVRDLQVDGDMRRRLQDIGMVDGTTVECVQRSPLGDPSAYWIRGAVIALRREDASAVQVERLR